MVGTVVLAGLVKNRGIRQQEEVVAASSCHYSEMALMAVPLESHFRGDACTSVLHLHAKRPHVPAARELHAACCM